MFNNTTSINIIMKQFSLLILIVFVSINSIHTAPRSRNRNNLPEKVYLSSQNGTNNIQIHLKDIEIIALLSDEAFGDYDYDYDYSDFTIKPNNLTTTTTTEKSVNQTTLSTSTTFTTTSTTPVSTLASSEEPVKIDNVQSNSPDKIRVSIIPTPELPEELRQETLPEIAHYRKCTSGYARDKNGRCRRVRRPAGLIPIDFGRIASNFVAKFRQNSDDSLPDLKQ